MNDFQKISISTLENNQLWVFKFNELSRESMDEWGEGVRAYRKTRPDHSRFLVYDGMQIQRAGLTPFMRAKINELAQEDRHATGRVAIVTEVPQTLLYLFETFVKITSRHTQPHLSVKFFRQDSAAIQWVLDGLKS